MSDNRLDDPKVQKAVRDVRHILDRRPQPERDLIVMQALDRGANVDAPRNAEESPQEARNRVLSFTLLLVLLLLILLLIAAATGRTDILRLPGSQAPSPTLGPRLNSTGQVNPQLASAGSRAGNPGDIAGINSLNGTIPDIGERFRAFYDQHGGERIFGRPISPQMQVNGRTIQWFERARLEEWPEYSGTPYAVQSARLGAEFTKGITFPKQSFFVTGPDIRYFAETGHGVSDRFYQFWLDNGGLDMLGYPLSDQVQETLPDKQIYTVQYFERGRIEYHPQLAGTPFEMQVGLLGRALYLNESKPAIITPPKPTAVPLP